MFENMNQVLHNIECARLKFGSTHKVQLVAATKCQSYDSVLQALSRGAVAAGENRVQEFLAKYKPNSDVEWQFIGTLQRNKVKYIIDKVSLIQSVDNAKLAEEINRQAALHSLVMPILIEVNVGGEAQKSGVAPAQINSLVSLVLQLPNVKLRGLMTVMPQGADRQLYLTMRSLYEQTAAMVRDSEFTVLSMGMSEDYVTAIECGANMVRLGTAIFGKRLSSEKINE